MSKSPAIVPKINHLPNSTPATIVRFPLDACYAQAAVKTRAQKELNMNPQHFLHAELEHAERQLARLRRIAAKMQTALEAAGLDEVAVYEKLAASKAYRQIQRDQVIFQQMWLRAHRHLERIAESPQPAQPSQPTQPLAARVTPFRRPPTPLRNQPCPCGSTLKYKRCCGNPLRQAA